MRFLRLVSGAPPPQLQSYLSFHIPDASCVALGMAPDKLVSFLDSLEGSPFEGSLTR